MTSLDPHHGVLSILYCHYDRSLLLPSGVRVLLTSEMKHGTYVNHETSQQENMNDV